MELPFVVAVNDLWQLQTFWLHPCKVCDQGRSVGKIKFTPNRKMIGVGVPRNFFFSQKVGTAEKLLKSRELNGAF